VAYRNPLPVAVALQPVYDTPGTALVVITRTIAPARGGTALPGGYVDDREDWRQAVVRELAEETGIDAAARDVRLVDAMSSPDGHLLLFGLLPERPAESLPEFGATDETDSRQLLRRPEELAFPLHTLAVRAWFDGRYG
jgi:ADP-ribose pyrophosphatase YjhB (NUDIX family)